MIRMFVVILAAAAIVVGVPRVDAAQQQKSSARASVKSSAGIVVNINSASAVELEALPGIGAKTAARIVEYRQKNGPFKKVEELMNVHGVGEKNFLKLKPQITIAAAKAEHEQQ